MTWQHLSSDQKDTELARKRRTYRENPEQREKAKSRATRYYHRNREKAVEAQRCYREATPRNVKLWFTAKRRAREAGVEFTISKDDVIVPVYCPVLRTPLVLSGGSGIQPNLPSLDRIDPTKGYVPGNVQVISHRANTLKNNSTFAEIEALYKHMALLHGRTVCLAESPDRAEPT